jgi:two-component SAPR family response regulator
MKTSSRYGESSDPSANNTMTRRDLLALLAGIKFKAEEYAEAARLYELGAKHDPTSDKWAKSLAQVYLKSGDEPKLAEILVGRSATRWLRLYGRP